MNRRALLAGLPAAAVAVPAVAAASDDPIFAALAEYQGAYDAWRAVFHDVDARIEAGHREKSAFFRIFKAAPTTAAGVATLLTWLAAEDGMTGDSRVTVLGDFENAALNADFVRQLQTAAAVLTAA
jgi:hypothetical protein